MRELNNVESAHVAGGVLIEPLLMIIAANLMVISVLTYLIVTGQVPLKNPQD